MMSVKLLAAFRRLIEAGARFGDRANLGSNQDANQGIDLVRRRERYVILEQPE